LAGQFIDDVARTTVQQTLSHLLDQIPDEFPLKRRRVQALVRQIDAVESEGFPAASG
jgi:hypothetical protein